MLAGGHAPTRAGPSSVLPWGLRFDHGIVLVSALPWLLFLVSDLADVGGGLLVLLLVYLGATHGLATVGILVDPGMRAHVDAHRAFYLGVPVVAVTGCVAVFALAPDVVVRVVVVALLLWQIQHYTKQNLGMVAFWTRARGDAEPTDRERRLIMLTSVVGFAGIARLADVGPWIDRIAQVVGIGAAAGLAVAVVATVGRTDRARLAILLGLVAFYLPVVVVRVDLFLAAYTYYVAHGAQYYLMVGAAVRPTRRSLMTAVVLLGIAGPLFTLAGMADPLGPSAWVLGLYKGVVVSHFLWDTRLWRLRDPEIRRVMQTRFPFLAPAAP